MHYNNQKRIQTFFRKGGGGGGVEGGAERLLFAGVGLGYPKLSVGNFGIFTNM